jgi:succinyl-diaminopimelate desuccinylase
LNLIETTKNLIKINSVTGSEEDVIQFIKSELTSNGFKGKILEEEGGLVAIPESSSSRIALVGHVDTVPISDNQIVSEDEDLIFGRGSVDMKSGVALIMKSLLDSPENIVGVFYTGEEGPYEENGLNSLLPVLMQEHDFEFSVILEPTDCEIQLGCLGALNASLFIRGKSAHSARPWMGENPIYKLDEVIDFVSKNEIKPVVVDGLEFKEILSITQIHSGVANNVIPEVTKLNINFRFSPEFSKEEASQYIVDNFSRFGDIEIDNVSFGAMPNRDNPMVSKFISSTEAEVFPKQAWTDVARFNDAGIPSINFGPGDPLFAHTSNEQVSKKQILESYELLHKFLKDF